MLIYRVHIAVLAIVIALVAASAVSAQLAQSSWPSFQGDMRNSGATGIATFDDGHICWTYLGLGGLEGSGLAVGADGVVYASTRGGVTAINPSGTVKWVFNGGPCNGVPAVGKDGTIYYGSLWGRLYALNPSGSMKWGYVFSGGVDKSSPVLDRQNNVYFATTTGYLYSFQGDTGHFNWGVYIGPSYSSPAIGNNNVIYTATTMGYLHAINRKGDLLWSTYVGAVGSASPSVAINGVIYLGTGGNNPSLVAVSHRGRILWRAPLAAGINGAPAIGRDGTLYVVSSDDRLVAISPNGRYLWDYAAPGIVSARWGSPIVDGRGIIYYVGRSATYDTFLLAVNPDGTERRRTRLPYGFVSTPAIGPEGQIYTNGSGVNCVGSPH